MGQMVIAHAVSGDLNGQNRSFAATTRRGVSDASDSTFLVADSWMNIITLTPAQSYMAVLINTGIEDAVFRIKTGTSYTRFNLPAGSATVVPLTGYIPMGTEEAGSYQLAVYSANGTTIRAIVAS